MPRLSEFYGIVIYMYFADHNPPHFHAIYAEHEALVRIDDGAIIRGDLLRAAAKLVEQWRTLHSEELLNNWALAQAPSALNPIEPLQWSRYMADFARVTAVEHLGARLLRVEFSDGVVRELDFAGDLSGVLATIDDDEVFPTVAVDRVAGTVSWANGVDFDPDVLRGLEAAATIRHGRLVREYRLESAT